MFNIEIQFKHQCGYGDGWMLFETVQSPNEAEWLKASLETGWANKPIKAVRIVHYVREG